MKQTFFNIIIALLILMVIAMIMNGLSSKKEHLRIPIKSMKSWQDADTPLGYEVNGSPPPFDPRFIRLSGFERASIPTALTLSSPLGSEHGALTYNAQPFWAMNHYRHGHHTGDDLNGIGGMNSDLGDPVFAVGNGIVIYRGVPSPGWGNVLMLAHKQPKGNIILSMYAHLKSIHVAYGSIVSRGKRIATVGTANGIYPAHLHFEIKDFSDPFIGPGYQKDSPGSSIDPSATIARSSNPDSSQLPRSIFSLFLNDKFKSFKDGMKINIK